MAHSVNPLIHGCTREAMAERLAGLGAPRYRAAQVWHWLYRRHATAWSAMTNLPPALRVALAKDTAIDPCRQAGVEVAPDGVRKLLVALRDGEVIEQVLIAAGPRRTVCVSSEVGCAYACAFCASGMEGLQRRLDAGEIVGQVMLATAAWGARPTHVVYMGMGEPLDNLDAVLTSIGILNDLEGLAIGARRITVSTCGVVPGIARLSAEGRQIELSVSLHAADNATRSRLMPVNRRWPLETLIPACRTYYARTGRIVTIEYTLIRDVNDRPVHAEALAALLAPPGFRVNLIPLSPVPEFEAVAADPSSARLFIDVLRRGGIHATLRASRGARVSAACGQLRRRRPS